MIRWPELANLQSLSGTVASFPVNKFLMFTARIFFRGLHTAFRNTTTKKGENPNCKHFQIIVIFCIIMHTGALEKIVGEVYGNKRMKCEHNLPRPSQKSVNKPLDTKLSIIMRKHLKHGISRIFKSFPTILMGV